MRRRLRVIAGAARSVILASAPHRLRPTTDRTREVLFSSLGEVVQGRPFIDLYAGSGAVGVEAVSRGAARCLFVELAAGCVRVIRTNLMRANMTDRAEIWRRDVGRAVDDIVAWLAGEPGVIFADPPYADARAKRVWADLLADGRVACGTIFVLEHSVRECLTGLPPPSWQRRVGETCLSRWERRTNV